jgi:hypothetical protein
MPAGFIDVGDIVDIEAKVIVGEVLGLAYNEYKLRTLCRIIKLPDLIGDIPIATKLTGQRHVPPLEEAALTKQAYVLTHFDLEQYGKNVVHIAISYEAGKKKNLVGDVLGMHTKDAAKSLAKMEDQDIAEILDAAGFTTQTGHDWGTSTNDPSVDIEDAMASLSSLDKGYEATHLLMHPLAKAKLISNDMVHKQVERGTMISGQIPKYCDLEIVTDLHVTPSTSAYVICKEAPSLTLGDGPSMVAKYDGGAAFFTGYAIAKFAEPKVVLVDSAIEITGIRT